MLLLLPVPFSMFEIRLSIINFHAVLGVAVAGRRAELRLVLIDRLRSVFMPWLQSEANSRVSDHFQVE